MGTITPCNAPSHAASTGRLLRAQESEIGTEISHIDTAQYVLEIFVQSHRWQCHMKVQWLTVTCFLSVLTSHYGCYLINCEVTLEVNLHLRKLRCSTNWLFFTLHYTTWQLSAGHRQKCNGQGSHSFTDKKMQDFSRTFQDPHDKFSRTFSEPTNAKI